MLYPNIKIEEKSKIQIKEKLSHFKNELKRIIKYFIFDRTNLMEKIIVKLHV